MTKNPHAVALGRKGGKVTSDRKAEAARENSRKGGEATKQRYAARRRKHPKRRSEV